MPPSEEDRESGPSSDPGDDSDPSDTADHSDPPETGDDSDRGENGEETAEEFVFEQEVHDIDEEGRSGIDEEGRPEDGVEREGGSEDEIEAGDGAEGGLREGERGAGPDDRRPSGGTVPGDADVPWNRNAGETNGIEDNETGIVRWFLDTDGVSGAFLREFVGSVLLVLFIGILLFAISGVWPPMVAVKSGSMEPHMERGDLVFVMDEDRLPPEAAIEGSGVATHQSSVETGYRRFGDYGDVIVYRKNGRADATPIIHRTRFWVTEGENWYGKANRSFVNGNSCEAIPNCPAPHAGFITKGDSNGQYDQISGISGPVKPGWIKGTAEARIPWLGHVRLELSKLRTGVALPVLGPEPVVG